MRYKILLFFTLIIIGNKVCTMAQISNSSETLEALPKTDRIVSFNIQDDGISLPIIWGLDTAWPSEENIRRGVAYVGPELVDVVRVSFQPTYPITDEGELTQDQKDYIDLRLNLVDFTGPDTKLVINCDHPSVDSWYVGNAERWAKLIELTTQRYQDAGRVVLSVAPFNEPDYGWGQGSIDDFYNIAKILQENPSFDKIRICGGNTLNCDMALEWYNFLKEYLDEGNTHQLAGSFDNYANFFETVRNNGHYATADELHNVMEAIVGAEYGMQTGIWWGTTEYARAEFVKASDGKRLAYTEHRPNWTAAAVYRNPDGEIKGFVGSSERQAVATTYRFVSESGDVFFNGYGPQREFIVNMPGGTGYQQGQTNAECVIDITSGDDVPDPIDGEYILVNKSNNKVMEIDGNSNLGVGSNIKVDTYNFTKEYQKWNVKPVANTVGGDFSYYSIRSSFNQLSLDILNWSLEDEGNVIAYTHAGGNNQQWFLEYAGDGWYYIRSRHSALCLENVDGNVQQGIKDGSDKQLWRFLDSNITRRIFIYELNTPQNLTAEERTASILLKWDAQSDATNYTILRSEQSGGPYSIIGRHITGTTFIDNKAIAGKTYYYVIRSLDDLLNKSKNSNEVKATVTNVNDIVLHYSFDGNLLDQSINAMNGVSYQTPSWTEDRQNGQAITLAEDNFIQLPTTCANHKQMTVATWMYWNGGEVCQKIFDFGCGEDRYMCLSPKTDKRTLRFSIKNKGEEEFIETISNYALMRNWVHLAVTIGENKVTLYVNGEEVASSSSINIRPTDFMPFLNYIGRSQFDTDPLFNGSIDDFIIYNYALSSEEIKALYDEKTVGIQSTHLEKDIFTINTLPADKNITINWNLQDKHTNASIYNVQGICMQSNVLVYGQNIFNVASYPEGPYILKLKYDDKEESVKFMVKH